MGGSFWQPAGVSVVFNFRKLFSKKVSPSDEAGSLPDSIDVQIVDGITIATFLKPTTVEEAKAAIRYIGAKGIYHRRIWDVSRIEFPFSMEELRELAYYGRGEMGDANRLALVVKDTVGFGSSRAFSTYREGDNVAQSRVFKTLDEAMRWVKADD